MKMVNTLFLALLVVSVVVSFQAYGEDMKVPLWVQSSGKQNNPLLDLGYLDVTLYNGWQDNDVTSR